MSESTFRSSSRGDDYLEWRERLAAKQEARRTRPESPPKPAPNAMWDPARLFESKEAAASPPESTPAPADVISLEGRDERVDPPGDAIDLRSTRATPTSSPDRSPDPSTPAPAPAPHSSDRPRRLALAATYLNPRPPAARPAARSIAAALQELNEDRLNGLIDDEEFKMRKAKLFSRRSGRADT